jgi:hypothetical protein
MNEKKGIKHMVCHVTLCGLAICIKKYLKTKEKLWKLNYFTITKFFFLKILLKKNQNPLR